MNKKVIVFGGGTGLSCLLRGLKQFPVSITAVVSVCDDGGSTGILRNEFDILAVGDIRKVLVALSQTESSVEELLNHRFKSEGTLNKHTVGNILLTAATEMTGSVQQGIELLGKVLNLCGNVMPVTESNVTLSAEMEAFALYYNAKMLNKKASCLMTVVDSKFIDKVATTEERETGLNNMITLALESALNI